MVIRNIQSHAIQAALTSSTFRVFFSSSSVSLKSLNTRIHVFTIYTNSIERHVIQDVTFYRRKKEQIFTQKQSFQTFIRYSYC